MKSLVLQFILAKGAGEAAIRRLLSFARDNGTREAGRVCADAEVLSSALRIGRGVAEAVVASRMVAEKLKRELDERGVQMLLWNSSDYPTSLAAILGRTSPPVLFVRGNVSLLAKPTVGFCGSRHSSERGLSMASACAESLSRKGVCVVSGYARGVDECAHVAAVKSGGSTIFVLAEGILSFSERPDVVSLLNEENHLFLSQFPPMETWYAHNAMRRNHTIVGLSRAMVVIEAGERGGTMAAGLASLEHHVPLYVIDYSNPPLSAVGNRCLCERGGVPLRPQTDGLIDICQIDLEGVRTSVACQTEQMTLFAGDGEYDI